MIRIQRSQCPAALVGRGAQGDHYNKRGVVDALWDMQHGKCCYCEMPIPEKGHLKAVEHFRPKAIFKGLRNEWGNLLLACAQCNGKKSDKFPIVLSDEEQEDKVLFMDKAKAGILDPSDDHDDPERHIDFDFSDEFQADFTVIMAKNESQLGTDTIDTIGLDGPFYARLRRERYLHVILARYLSLLEAFHAGDAQRLEIQKEKFGELMAPNAVLAGFARAFARYKQLDNKVQLQIPGG